MAMILPTAVNSKTYALLPGGQYYSTRRNGDVLGIVLHITAGLEDFGLQGADSSMEDTIAWANRDRPQASWHAGADSDDLTLCLPDWYTAWHVVGYNSRTVGLEISKHTTDWSKAPKAWVEATLRNAAKYCAAIGKKHNLPIKLCNKAEVDYAIAHNKKFGFSYHMWLNPQNRSDPGKNFPIAQLFQYILEELGDNMPSGIDLARDAWGLPFTTTGVIGRETGKMESPIEILTRIDRNLNWLANFEKVQSTQIAKETVAALVAAGGPDVNVEDLARAIVTQLVKATEQAPVETPPAN